MMSRDCTCWLTRCCRMSPADDVHADTQPGTLQEAFGRAASRSARLVTAAADTWNRTVPLNVFHWRAATPGVLRGGLHRRQERGLGTSFRRRVRPGARRAGNRRAKLLELAETILDEIQFDNRAVGEAKEATPLFAPPLARRRDALPLARMPAVEDIPRHHEVALGNEVGNLALRFPYVACAQR